MILLHQPSRSTFRGHIYAPFPRIDYRFVIFESMTVSREEVS